MRSPEDHPTLLIWHVTGALAPAQADAVVEHLAWCAPCAREARALASLRKSLMWQGLTDHPPPEEMISVETGPGLDPCRRDLVEAHISDCGECREDRAAIRRARRVQRAIETGASIGPAPLAAGSPRRDRWRLGLAAAVLTLALPAAVVLWRSGAPPPPGGAESIVFTPPVRGAHQDQALDGEGPWSIRIVLPTDAPGGEYRFRVAREDGSLAQDGREPSSADGDGSLRIRLESLPPGARYRLLVWPEHGLEGGIHEYPFQVIDAPAGPPGARTARVGFLKRRQGAP